MTKAQKNKFEGIKIENGIPVPERRTSQHYDFIIKMKSGQSFFLNERQFDLTKAINGIRAWSYSREVPVTTRRVEGGARIWKN